MAKAPKSQLHHREDWIRAAFEALAEGGIDELRVERLARRLGMTKGSFYHHFEDRSALLHAVLARWEGDSERVIARLERMTDPRERLAALIAEAWSDPLGLAVEAALLSSASSNAHIAEVNARLTKRRHAYISSLYRKMGSTRAEARRRATITYGCFIGTVQLFAAQPELLGGNRERRVQVATLVELLAR